MKKIYKKIEKVNIMNRELIDIYLKLYLKIVKKKEWLKWFIENFLLFMIYLKWAEMLVLLNDYIRLYLSYSKILLFFFTYFLQKYGFEKLDQTSCFYLFWPSCNFNIYDQSVILFWYNMMIIFKIGILYN